MSLGRDLFEARQGPQRQIFTPHLPTVVFWRHPVTYANTRWTQSQSVDPESAGQRETQCTGRQGTARDIHKVSTRGSRGSASATERPARPAHLRGAGHARNSSEVDVMMLATLRKASSKSAASPMDFQRCTVGGSAAGPSLSLTFLTWSRDPPRLTVSGPSQVDA